MKVKRYNKLVRDKIPEICLINGAKPAIRFAKDEDEYIFIYKKD